MVPFPQTGLLREDVRRKVRQGRLYVWPPQSADPVRYLSVTTAMKSIPKEWLGAWAAKVVAETAVQKLDLLTRLAADDPAEATRWLKGAPWSRRDKAGDDGTALHEVAELDALGQRDEADTRVAPLSGAGQRKADPVARLIRN